MASGRRWASNIIALCVLTGLLTANEAAANGRFPRAQRLLEDPRDVSHLILAATYGLLVTNDRGASWRYVCEAAYGERELTVDALTAFSSDGALLAGIYSGVSRSERDACDFQRTLGENNREAVPDFALAPSEPGRVLAIMVAIPPDAEPYSLLYRSDDDGRSWRPLGGRLPEVMRAPLTIDVAPSDSQRIYVSGLGADDAGVLLRSDDGGESFAAFPIPTDGRGFEYPYIAAVDAAYPDRLYVRTDYWQYDSLARVATARDALLYSDDAGETFSELIRASGKLLGFAFSPDDSELLLGYGDPRDAGGNRLTDPAALGIYRAAKGSSELEKRYAGSVGCLTWTEQGIYACMHESETGSSLGLIEQTNFDLTSPPQIEPLLVLADVVGPIECEACSASAVCQNYWQSTCQSWGRFDCADLRAPACQGAAGAGAAGGAGNADSGAAGGGPSNAGGPNRAGASFAAAAAPSGGCGCRVGRGRESEAGVVVLVLLLGARRRWRRTAKVDRALFVTVPHPSRSAFRHR